MLKVQEIREIIKLVDQSSIDEFQYENAGTKLVMKKNSPVETRVVSEPVPVQYVEKIVEPTVEKVAEVKTSPANESGTEAPKPTVADDSQFHKIVSPMVGTFYQSPSPDADPYVSVGSKVSESTVVCIVEAMKLFNEIEAEVKGEIVEILVKDGQLVEYGQPLFLVKPE